jgi:hypothetical protein
VKLVDAGDSKSPAARRAGSIPASGTRIQAASVHAEAAFSLAIRQPNDSRQHAPPGVG